ncbi:MAG TPA: ABC transporter permease [Terracidiphilus sp.]|nr:ABC transporter permease [Terracidiphilus sp.]
MSLSAYFRSLASRFFRRESVSCDVEEELRAHIALRADDLERTGLSRAEAERRARIEFGARDRYREESFATLGGNAFDNVVRDVLFSLRVLRKSPGFTLIAVATLALAIGANSLVFALLNALILRPLQIPDAQNFWDLDHIGALSYLSYPEYLDLRDRNHTLAGIAAYTISNAAIDTGADPAPAWLIEASGNYFDLAGIQPFLGRFFHPSDERGPNSAPYVVLTYNYWHTHFRDDRGVVGRTIRLNKHPFTILGVAPPGFIGTLAIFSTDMWVPIVNQQQIDGLAILADRGSHSVMGAGVRLKPGVTTVQAAADLNAVRLDQNRAWPKFEQKEPYCLVRPGIGGNFLGTAITAFLGALMLLASLILLAACANLGSLFAARASDRSREVALRLALGARRARILRQLFTEAILISLAGGAAGLAGSLALLHALTLWRPFPQFPMNIPVSPDARVYLVALFLALASGFLFGAVPVRLVLRTDPYQVIKSTSISSARAGRRITLRDVLVAVQIAICAVLVTSSFVALRGLARSLNARLGVDPQHVMLAEVNLSMAGYSDESGAAFERRMLDAMKTIPGVTQAALANNPPLKMGWDVTSVFSDQTADLRPSNEAFTSISYNISPEYFQTAGTTLFAGRAFTWNDDKSSPPVAIVNAEFARRLFGSSQNALGRHFKMRSGTSLEVVGIAEDGKYTANLAESPQPAVFRPLLQAHYLDIWLMVRSTGDPQILASTMRNRLRNLDRSLPIFSQTWNESMNGALFAPRMATASLGILGLMGAILSITGIFGLAAYSVSKRLKELGIRIALGARRSEVLGAALGRAVRLLAIGSAAGLVLGFLASRVLAFIVYQATPRDPLVLAGVVVAMALLGLLATWIPAQRALAVNPLVLLRED